MLVFPATFAIITLQAIRLPASFAATFITIFAFNKNMLIEYSNTNLNYYYSASAQKNNFFAAKNKKNRENRLSKLFIYNYFLKNANLVHYRIGLRKRMQGNYEQGSSNAQVYFHIAIELMYW